MDSIQRLLDIMATLRSPEGCPWDKEQNHQSIRSQLIEECYELVEAIDNLDDKHMKEELGDLLLHIVFHSQMAKERGAFDFEQVTTGISDKLIRRHPHVFSKDKVNTSDEVIAKWHEIKKEEKPERTSVVDGVPRPSPSLMRAQEIQKKAARVGFDWSDTHSVVQKIREELNELINAIDARHGIEEEVGDLLFSVVNLSRHVKVDAEQACRLATDKFVRRFQWVENRMKTEGKPMESATMQELDEYWIAAKAETRAGNPQP